ncbi:PH domain-containing protein [uncultured Thiohalocapsa sp.]|uniref:PH domain-containing protein n=1 Tax=uncultured Thiohalocapsa sp. TaxID=768990 RepID=UPI0025F753DC|nr:PH domain-containing protein [uncultured Thiohalocapsa sp.]
MSEQVSRSHPPEVSAVMFYDPKTHYDADATDLSYDSPLHMKMRMPEKILYEKHPVMFDAHPVGYLLLLFLIPVLGLGLLVLLLWWLQCMALKVTVTNKRVIVREGILSKRTNEVYHAHIRNIRVSQPVVQRLADVGKVEIASAGSATYEISVEDLPDVQEIQKIVDRYRR